MLEFSIYEFKFVQGNEFYNYALNHTLRASFLAKKDLQENFKHTYMYFQYIGVHIVGSCQDSIT